MTTSASARSKNQSRGSNLIFALISVALVAWLIWLAFPPLETLRYQKYNVQSTRELVMPWVSFPDVGPRPISAFSADGKVMGYLANKPETDANGVDGDPKSEIKVIEVETATPIGIPLPIADSATPIEIEISLDGNFVAAAGAGEVRVWDLRQQRLVATLALPSVRLQARRHVALSRDGKRLVTCVQEDGTDPALWVYDTETGQPLRKMERTAGTATNERFVFHPSVNQLIGTGDTESGGTALCVWDIETGKITREMLASDNCRTLAYALSHERDRIAVAMVHGAREYTPYSTTIFDLETWTPVSDLVNDDFVFWLAFSPDGSQLSLVDGSGTASIWSTQSGIRLQNFRLGPPSATAFSAQDGALLLITNSKDQPGSVQLLTLRPSE